jgi:quercetin dioxygenase-like cupin family protein
MKIKTADDRPGGERISAKARSSTRRWLSATAGGLVATGAMALLNWSGTAWAAATSGWHTDMPPAKAFFEKIRVFSRVTDSDNDAFVSLIANEPSDVYVNHIIADPGANSGWHTHPGPSVVVVKRGTATVDEVEDSTCVEHTYPAGTGFIDQGGEHVHLVRNASSTDTLEVYAFQVIPSGLNRVVPVDDPGVCPGL